MHKEKHSPLSHHRRRLGLKQSAIAAGLEISVSTLSAMENGHRLPNSLEVVGFAREYKVDLKSMIELLEETKRWRSEQAQAGDVDA